MRTISSMKRVAVFGNAAGGKSTLATRLVSLTRLPLYSLDLIQFRARGGKVIYVDLPVITHFRWATKRLLKGLFATPEGWPEGSAMWRSTMGSYKVVWLCNRRLAPRYRALVADAAAIKQVHHLKSPAEIAAFLGAAEHEYARALGATDR